MSLALRLTLLALLAFGGFILLGPLLYGVSAFELSPKSILLPPSLEHPFGTDRLGRDVFARVLYGGQTSLLIGVGSALFASFVSLIVGISAGYFQGKVDKSIVVIIDLFLTFPTFFLLLALVSYIEASTLVLIVVISITGWMGGARMIRSEAFAIGEKPFIKVLLLGNVSPLKIILKYYAPLLAPIFLIGFTFGVSGAILAESGLSFLGLGVMPPQISWGSMLSEGREVMDIAWWVSFFPGFFIFLISFLLIQLSDTLQQHFNAKDTPL